MCSAFTHPTTFHPLLLDSSKISFSCEAGSRLVAYTSLIVRVLPAYCLECWDWRLGCQFPCLWGFLLTWLQCFLHNFPLHLAHEHLLCGEHDYFPNDLPALDPAITAGPCTLLVDVTGILNGDDMQRYLYHSFMALPNSRVRHIISIQ